MPSKFLYLPLALCLLFSHVAPSPIYSLQERQETCGNTAAIFESSCWTSEQVAFYLSDPTTGENVNSKHCSPCISSDDAKCIQGWAYTTPKCDPANPDGVGCCTTDETWSTCFIRLGRGLAGANCNVVNAQECTWDDQLATNLSSAIVPKVRYVLKNIYTINDFFTTYYEGM